MTTTRTNRNTTTRLLFTDGAEHFETHRDTWGGFLNMLDRVAARDGLAARSTRSGVRTSDGQVLFTQANGRTFTVEEGWTRL